MLKILYGLDRYARLGHIHDNAEDREAPPTLTHSLQKVMFKDYGAASAIISRFQIPVYFWNHLEHAEIAKYAKFSYNGREFDYSITLDGCLGVSSIIKFSLWPNKKMHLFETGLCGIDADKYGIFAEPIITESYYSKLDTDAYAKAKAREQNFLDNDIRSNPRSRWRHYNPHN